GAMVSGELSLVGDIGATSARFAIVRPDGTISSARVFSSQAYTDIADAILSYLAEEPPSAKPTVGVVAIAAAMVGDRVRMSNHPWTFSTEDLRMRLGLKKLPVINDFTANALAIPELDGADVVQVGAGLGAVGAPIGVIGPGTGLGVSALLMHE